MQKLRPGHAAACILLLHGFALASEPALWSTGKIDKATPAVMSHPMAAAFLESLTASSRNKTEAVRMEATHDAMARGYGQCVAIVPASGAPDKVFIHFFPHAASHDGPEKFHEREFIQYRNGAHWTHVDLKMGFPGLPPGEPRTATLSAEQEPWGSHYRLYSGLDLYPQFMQLWKHKISLLEYLQGSTQTLFEVAVEKRDGRDCLVFRTGGTPEEVVMDPAKGFALVEHTYAAGTLKMSTKVLQYEEIKPGQWIPKRAEHIFDTTIIKLNVVEFKTLPMKELEDRLFYPFAPGWTIHDKRNGKTFTIGDPSAAPSQE